MCERDEVQSCVTGIAVVYAAISLECIPHESHTLVCIWSFQDEIHRPMDAAGKRVVSGFNVAAVIATVEWRWRAVVRTGDTAVSHAKRYLR